MKGTTKVAGVFLLLALFVTVLAQFPRSSQAVLTVARDKSWAANSASAPNAAGANAVVVTVTETTLAGNLLADTFDVTVANLTTGEKAYGNVTAAGATIAGAATNAGGAGVALNTSGTIRVVENAADDGKFVFTITVLSNIPADEDANNNDLLTLPGEDDGAATAPPDNANGVLDQTRVGAKIGDGGAQRQVGWIRGFHNNVIRVTAGPLPTTFVVDTVGPTFSAISPADPFVTSSTSVVLSGQMTDPDSKFPTQANLGVNDLKITVVGVGEFGPASMTTSAIDNGFSFSLALTLPAGAQQWFVTSKDVAGNVVKSDRNPLTTPVFGAVIGAALPINPNTGAAVTCADAGVTVVIDADASGTCTAGDTVDAGRENFRISIDNRAPTLVSAKTGDNWTGTAVKTAATREAKANSVRVTFTDDAAVAADGAGGGLDAASVVPGDFSVEGQVPTAVQVVDIGAGTKPLDIFLTLGTDLTSGATPNVSIVGSVLDKAGNSLGAGLVKATDGLGPKLTATLDKDLATGNVKVSITTDELLVAAPTITLGAQLPPQVGAVIAGTVSTFTGALASCADPQTITVTTDADASGGCTAGDTVTIGVVGDVALAAAVLTATPLTATSFELTITPAVLFAIVPPVGAAPGSQKVNVRIDGADTTAAGNPGRAGATRANATGALTYQLDNILNGGLGDVAGEAPGLLAVAGRNADVGVNPEIDFTDPLFVTINWAGEGMEYNGDNKAKVTLQNLTVKVLKSDGTTQTLTVTPVSDDSITYVMGISNPTLGDYTITFGGKDEAGNDKAVAGAATATTFTRTFKLKAPAPFNVNMAPGWNLMSVPQSPANPAINSVITSSVDVDLVMTWDAGLQTFLVSRKNPATGLFEGDVTLIEAGKGYFARSSSFKPLSLLLPAVTTPGAPPPPPPAISVATGWNLVGVSTLQRPAPTQLTIANYFATLTAAGIPTWSRAYTFSPLTQTWITLTPGAATAGLVVGGAVNPYTARVVACTDVGLVVTTDADASGTCTAGDTVFVPGAVVTGMGYWLFTSQAGTLVP